MKNQNQNFINTEPQSAMAKNGVRLNVFET